MNYNAHSRENMSSGNSEDVSHLIFSACDPDGSGDIPVSHLINYIDKEMQSCYDRSLLQQLKIMLLVSLGFHELHIRKESFDNIVKDWILYVQDYKLSQSDLQSDDSQYDDFLTAYSYSSDIISPVSSTENSSYIRRKLEEQLTDMERQRKNLTDENNKLKALLKDNEDALQTLTVDHNNLLHSHNVKERKLHAFKIMQQDFQELETTRQAQQSTIQDLQSKVKCIEKEKINLEKSNACLQTIVGTLKEEKTEAVKTSENLRRLFSEAKSEISQMKLKFDATLLKYDSEKTVMLEKLKDLEMLVSDLKNTVVFLKEKNVDLEDELSKRKITYNQEPEKCQTMWKYLDESLNDVSETLKLLSCEQESEALLESETNLRDELQASGDICLGHTNLVVELADCQEKLEDCSSELIDCEKNLNFMNDAIHKIVELLKQIQLDSEQADAFSDEMEKITAGVYSGPYMLLVLDLFAELEKVSKLIKTGPHSSKKLDGQNEMETSEKETQTANVDYSCSSQSDICCGVHSSQDSPANGSRSQPLSDISSQYNLAICDSFFEVSHTNRRVSLLNNGLSNVKAASASDMSRDFSIDSTSDLIVREGRGGLTPNRSSSIHSILVRILRFLLMCGKSTISYGGKTFKVLMLLFILWILHAISGYLIYECANGNNCGCSDIGELLSPHLKLVHHAPPPV